MKLLGKVLKKKDMNSNEKESAVVTLVGTNDEAEDIVIGTEDLDNFCDIKPAYLLQKIGMDSAKDFLNQLAKDRYRRYYIRFKVDDSYLWVPISSEKEKYIEKLKNSASLDDIIDKINEIIDCVNELKGKGNGYS